MQRLDVNMQRVVGAASAISEAISEFEQSYDDWDESQDLQ
jgi:hypothetical protein